MPNDPATQRLDGWQVLVLRPSAECSGLRRRLAALGARLHCSAPWRIVPAPEQVDSLNRAMRLPLWVVTSPNAVRCAAGLLDLSDFHGLALAVGPGTARALRRAGVARVRHPEGRFDSEGLLAQPELAAAHRVALLTGVGGRGVLDRELTRRGAGVERVDVYRRVPRRWTPRALQAVRSLPQPRVLLLSSVEALHSGGSALAAALSGFAVIAASPRVAEAARQQALRVMSVADSASADSLLRALQRHAKQGPIR